MRANERWKEIIQLIIEHEVAPQMLINSIVRRRAIGGSSRHNAFQHRYALNVAVE